MIGDPPLPRYWRRQPGQLPRDSNIFPPGLRLQIALKETDLAYKGVGNLTHEGQYLADGAHSEDDGSGFADKPLKPTRLHDVFLDVGAHICWSDRTLEKEAASYSQCHVPINWP